MFFVFSVRRVQFYYPPRYLGTYKRGFIMYVVTLKLCMLRMIYHIVSKEMSAVGGVVQRPLFLVLEYILLWDYAQLKLQPSAAFE